MTVGKDFKWKKLTCKDIARIEKEGKIYRMQIQTQKRKKFGKAGISKLNKRENSEVEQEISLRLEMAELSMNFEIYKKQRDRESLRTSIIEPAGRKTRCKMAGKS